MAAPTPGASGSASSTDVLNGSTSSDTGARAGGAGGLHGEYSTATGQSNATITPGDGGMAREAVVLISGITSGKNMGVRGLLLLQCLWLPPPPAPIARVIAPASSPAAPHQISAHGGEGGGGTLSLLVTLPLLSLAATVI